MNAQLTSEIRGLTAAELDAVSGGVTTEFSHPSALDFGIAVGVVGCLGWIIGCLFTLIFD